MHRRLPNDLAMKANQALAASPRMVGTELEDATASAS